MKRSIIVVMMLSLVLLLVVSCAPKTVPTSTGAAATSPEEQQIASGLDDLKELDSLENSTQDVSFDDVDALGYGQ